MNSLDLKTMEHFMGMCISLAEEAANNGNYPLGSLVYRKGDVISFASSKLIESCDPTAHPEVIVIREAAKKLGSRYLPECILFTTLEPCPMCTSAAIWAKMEGVVFGATQKDAIAVSEKNEDKLYTWRQIKIDCKTVVNAGEPLLFVNGGILREECLRLFSIAKYGRT